jgi:putative heme-binding domain-containing protein
VVRSSLLVGVLVLLGLCGQFLAQAPGQQKQPKKGEITPADALDTLPGFQVELLHASDSKTEGSWINMCKDNKGRLIISGQNRQPILRVTIGKDGTVSSITKLDLPISEAMGLLYAHDSLYVNGAGPNGFGLYRCRDTKGTDQYDSVVLLKNFSSGGEHGAHAVVLGPDQNLYIINGNHTRVPDGIEPNSPHRNYREDFLLPREWDGNGHAAGIYAPGGYVLRTDPEGKKWDLMLAGFRNAYDMAFNGDGELFTFDSDMEWDWGMPWYRPIRVNHCTSGAEFGWRSGTGKWPAYYPDSLPGIDVGIGSPTGVVCGTGARFPAKYQKALYIQDWTYGRIIAVHLTPQGSSYTATMENFIAPKGLKGNGQKRPLPLTDMCVGDDGALYFVIGGRNNQSGLYRVSYKGSESTAPAKLQNEAGAAARKLRHELEAFHGKVDPKAVELAWPHLSSDDRFLRWAARLAIESQPVAQWKEKAVSEKNPQAAIEALLALAHYGDRATQPDLIKALERFPLANLPEALQLQKLRVLGLSISRQGQPSGEPVRKLLAELEPLLPGPSDLVNREVAMLLINLHSPKVLARCLKLMADAKTQEEQIHYLFHLRTLPFGFWTLEQRQEYLKYYLPERKKLPHPTELVRWFEDAGRPYGDGASFGTFYKKFLREFVANLSPAELTALKPSLEAIDKAAASANYDYVIETFELKGGKVVVGRLAEETKEAFVVQPPESGRVTIKKEEVASRKAEKPRQAVKVWKMDELVPMLEKVDSNRNFTRGKEMYRAAQCLKCHRFLEEGGAVGPDLTSVGNRFGRREVLESILLPSAVISEQYMNETFELNSGKVVVGRVVDETADAIAVQPNPLEPARVTLKKKEIDSRTPSKVSPMPEHLADVLTMEELLDLIAYMESGGRPDYRSFRPR